MPGEIVHVSIIIKAPDTPGLARLQLTLVQEGVAWFETKGFAPALLEVSILSNELGNNISIDRPL